MNSIRRFLTGLCIGLLAILALGGCGGGGGGGGNSSHAVTISGTVYAACPPNGSTVTGATISSNLDSTTTMSDGNGNFSLTTAFTAGGSQLWTLTVTAPGFATGVFNGSGNSSPGQSVCLNASGPALLSITVTPASFITSPGASVLMTAIGTYSNNTTKDLTSQVTWSSSMQSVGTVSNVSGVASAVGVGSTTIEAMLGGVSGSTTLVVADTAGVIQGGASAFSNLPGTAAGSAKSYSLYLLQSIVTFSGSTIASVENDLIDSANFSSLTKPYSDSGKSYFLGGLTADTNGNLWTVKSSLPTASVGSKSIEIDKFIGANTNPSTLALTPVIALPANIVVQSKAFDGSNNLWVVENSVADSAADIVEYTAVSLYQSVGTTVRFAAPGFTTTSTDYCGGTSIAFDAGGNLVAYEAYKTASGAFHCSGRFVKYNASSLAASTVNQPDVTLTNFNSASDFVLAGFNPAGDLLAIKRPQTCSNGTGPNCLPILGAIVKLPTGWTGSSSFTNVYSLPWTVDSFVGGTVDANGNLWFGSGSASIGGCTSSAPVNSTAYEFPAGSPTPSGNFAYRSASMSCSAFTGVAITGH